MAVGLFPLQARCGLMVARLGLKNRQSLIFNDSKPLQETKRPAEAGL
jgi:hypothetical protein